MVSNQNQPTPAGNGVNPDAPETLTASPGATEPGSVPNGKTRADARLESPGVARNVQRGIETREAIKAAATKLFGTLGYEQVTMRQIAVEAACSHTAIYLYFKDKESLLQAIAVEPLQKLRDKLAKLIQAGAEAETLLIQLANRLVLFCLENRRLYRVFFATAAARVDMPQAEGTLNALRNELFAQLRGVMAAVLSLQSESDAALQAARIYFYMLQGIAATYDQSEESTDDLLVRLETTFDRAFRATILGLKEVKV